MSFTQNLPNRERMSVVVSTIMLTYGLSQAISLPSRGSQMVIGGILIPIEFDLTLLITLAVAGMTASGTDWILRDHPALAGKLTLPHLLLPTLSAWVLGISLNNLADVPFKWLVLIVGGGFLLLVVVAEYIVLNPEDYRAPIGIALLTAIAYAMLLALSVALESTDQRLIVSVPAIGLGAGVLSTRIIQLQTGKVWPLLAAGGTLLMVTQLAAALHYLPITPLAYGIMILGAFFSMVNMVINLDNQVSRTRTLIEAVIPFALTFILALWIN